MNILSNLKSFFVYYFFSPPKFVIKNKFLNIFGLQIIRIFIMLIKNQPKKFLFNLRKNNSKENKIKLDLEKNGYSIIEDYFEINDFNFIKETIELLKNENIFKNTNYGNTKVLIGPLSLTKNYKSKILKINKLFKDAEGTDFIENILHTKIDNFPDPTYQELNLEKGFVDEDDINSEFHPDRYYPCVKSFFYINDNSSENGAFQYYSGSHKLNLNRFIFEYYHSVFYNSKTPLEILKKKSFEKINGRITLNNSTLNKLFGEPITCYAPENSFVISNNMGFHRRGKMSEMTTRKHLRNDYYDFQISPIFRNLKHFLKKKYFNP